MIIQKKRIKILQLKLQKNLKNGKKSIIKEIFKFILFKNMRTYIKIK